MKLQYIVFLVSIWATTACKQGKNAVVFQTDFGLKDGAVSAMKGVATSVDPDLSLYDNTHEIPAYNIWEAAYRLDQSIQYWPKGTVFVSVVDPGVGTDRRSVVVLTKSGHYIVTPDNGTLTLIEKSLGIERIRLIDEAKNRRQNSGASYTFHGRDVYAYTAARLASKTISFEEVGPLFEGNIVRLPYKAPHYSNGILEGTIPVLDVQYGNIWTNIPAKMILDHGIQYGDSVSYSIFFKDSLVHQNSAKLVHTFGEVPDQMPLVYFNSLMEFSIALNMGDYSKAFGIGSGNDWHIQLKVK